MTMANELDELLPPTSPLPASLVFTERAAALLRAYLLGEGLDDYHIYVCEELDLADIDNYFEGLGESEARWQPLAASETESVALLTYGIGGARRWPAGV